MTSAMVIPAPKYQRVPYNLTGLSWWRQLLVVSRQPPQMQLLEDWMIIFPGGLRIVVPKGFITDGASIPVLLWWLIAPFGPLLEGAILHDFGYQHGYLLSPYDPAQIYNMASLRMRSTYCLAFKETIPVYVGRDRQFFDELLYTVAVAASGATFQAGLAYRTLRAIVPFIWYRYRRLGPGAFNSNSLNLPGVK